MSEDVAVTVMLLLPILGGVAGWAITAYIYELGRGADDE